MKDDVLEEIIHENSLPREKRERFLEEEKKWKAERSSLEFVKKLGLMGGGRPSFICN